MSVYIGAEAPIYTDINYILSINCEKLSFGIIILGISQISQSRVICASYLHTCRFPLNDHFPNDRVDHSPK